VTVTAVSFNGADDMLRLSPEALDRLRGVLLAERDTWAGRLGEYEATLASASFDAFGAEVRQLAKASIARVRDIIDDIDHTLERLVQTYGSCEWCDMVIPSEVLQAISRARLCRACQRHALRRR
jgi:RNA polymerase-binding transcription factor DksA